MFRSNPKMIAIMTEVFMYFRSPSTENARYSAYLWPRQFPSKLVLIQSHLTIRRYEYYRHSIVKYATVGDAM